MRTRTISVTIAAMSIAGLTLNAQRPQTPPTPPTPQTQTTPRTAADQRTDAASRSAAEQTVTVTGCVQQGGVSGATGTGSAGATAGSSAAGGTMSGSNQSRSANFVLANAKMAPGSATSALGTATRFSLSGMSDADLTKHVNHQVEVTGRLTAASMSGTGAGAHGGSATGTTGASGTTNDMPLLHATNIKMISATCPAQQ